MSNSEGYLLRAVGKEVYFEMNLCLAASIRFHGDSRPISVFTDNPEHWTFKKYPSLWDRIIDLKPLVDELRVKFNRDFDKFYELGGLVPRLLCKQSPYERTISIDGDCMVLRSTEDLWKVFDDYNITFLGCLRMYPDRGVMDAKDIIEAEIQIEDDFRGMGQNIKYCHLREAHGGIMWWDKSDITNTALDIFDEVIKNGCLYKYFPKVIKLWGVLPDEVLYAYVMSVLDLPVVPYNSNLMGSNPEYFSVEKSEGNMGHFLIEWGNKLLSHMEFKDSVPVFVHFFAKDKDPNYVRNRDFLINWLGGKYVSAV